MSKTLLRKSFPKVRIVSVKGQALYQVDARKQGTSGKREHFTTSEKALSRAREIADDIEQHGYGAPIPLQLRAMALRCSELLAKFGKTIDDATTHYVEFLEAEQARSNSATVAKLADDWLSDKKRGTKKQLRQDTLDDIEETANLLKKLFPSKRLGEVTHTDIESYLDGLTVSLRRKYNRKNLMGQFFNWSRKKGYTTVNPCEGIEIVVPSTDPRILTVEECEALLRLVEKPQHADMRGYLAICLFAGLRPTECQLLKWEKIDLDERQITVLGSTSKIKETRTVSIEPTLADWLQPIAQRSGFVTSPTNFRPRFERLKIAVGYRVNGENENGKEWIEDGLRHSYASYWLGKYQDRAHLAEYMGTSLKMIKQHYKSIVARSKVDAFWGLLPAAKIEERKRELAEIAGSF
jgi:integrase